MKTENNFVRCCPTHKLLYKMFSRSPQHQKYVTNDGQVTSIEPNKQQTTTRILTATRRSRLSRSWFLSLPEKKNQSTHCLSWSYKHKLSKNERMHNRVCSMFVSKSITRTLNARVEQIVVIAFVNPNKEVKTLSARTKALSHSKDRKNAHKTINHPFLLLILFHAALSVTKGKPGREKSKVCFVDYSAYLTINFPSNFVALPRKTSISAPPSLLTSLVAWENSKPSRRKREKLNDMKRTINFSSSLHSWSWMWAEEEPAQHAGEFLWSTWGSTRRRKKNIFSQWFPHLRFENERKKRFIGIEVPRNWDKKLKKITNPIGLGNKFLKKDQKMFFC